MKKFVEDGSGYLESCEALISPARIILGRCTCSTLRFSIVKHWARGNGDVELSLTADAKKFLKAVADAVTVRYAQGRF